MAQALFKYTLGLIGLLFVMSVVIILMMMGYSLGLAEAQTYGLRGACHRQVISFVVCDSLKE